MAFPLRGLPEAIIILDSDNQIIGVNPAGEHLLNMKRTDLIGKSVDSVFPRQPSSIFRNEVLEDGRKEVSLSRSDGQSIFVELTISTINGLNGKQLGRVVLIRDSAQAEQSEMRLKQEESLRTQNLILRALQETTLDLHSSLDLDIVLSNIVERACKLLDTTYGYLYSWEEEADDLKMVIGTGALKKMVGYSIVKGEGVAGTVWETEKPVIVSDYDNWPGRSGGFSYGVISSVIGMPLILKDKVVGVLGVAHSPEKGKVFTNEDVTVLNQFTDMAVVALQNARLFEKAQKEIDFRRKTEIELRNANQLLQLQIERIEMLQEQLQELAVRDPLTELYNRRYLQESLEIEFAHPERSSLPTAILMMDSDHLKEINDKYGHKAGDDFLVHISKTIRKSVRTGDIACRYGGDEFVVVLSNVTKETALSRAEKLRKKIASHSIVHRNEKVTISVSIGIAMFPEHGSVGEILLQKADQALYEAKRMGKNRVLLYGEY
ncbi:MAG: diguanylate cyclase [Anaerolineales bacterium]|jgi:diguanylate cyclase (GGDEF)-like protein/PAS domain S-box-containing protein